MPGITEQLLTIPLTMQQLKVLAILVTETDGNTVHGLATTLGVSVATMSGILDRLTSHGMATRTQDPDDQRVRRVLATPQGRETVRRLIAAQHQVDSELFDRMALEDLRKLTQGIGRCYGRWRRSRPTRGPEPRTRAPGAHGSVQHSDTDP